MFLRRFGLPVAALLSVGLSASAQDFHVYESNSAYFECRRAAKISNLVATGVGYSFGSNAIRGRSRGSETDGSIVMGFGPQPGLEVFGLPIADGYVSWQNGLEVRSATIDGRDFQTVVAAVRAGYPGIRFLQGRDVWIADLPHSLSPVSGVGAAQLEISRLEVHSGNQVREEVSVRCRAPIYIPGGAGERRSGR